MIINYRNICIIIHKRKYKNNKKNNKHQTNSKMIWTNKMIWIIVKIRSIINNQIRFMIMRKVNFRIRFKLKTNFNFKIILAKIMINFKLVI